MRGPGAASALSLLVAAAALSLVAAVAPTQPLNALVLPRQPAAAESGDVAQPAPAAADATRDAYAAALLSGDTDASLDASRDRDAGHAADGAESEGETSYVSTEDNQLVGTSWGAGSWSLGGLARQPGELPPRAGPGATRFARYTQAAALPQSWGARIGEWGLIPSSAGSGGAAAAGSDEPAAMHNAVRVEGTADAVAAGEASDGESGRLAASVLAAMTPAAAALAAEPGVASVGVHVSVTRESSLTQQPGGGVTMSHDWHVSTATDVEVSDDDADITAAAMPRLAQLGAMLRDAAATQPRGAQGSSRVDAQLLAAAADRAAEQQTRRERQAESMAWQMAAVLDPSSVVFEFAVPRTPPEDGSVLGETPSERALGLAVLAILWVFVGVFIGRQMYSEDDEEDDGFDDACCKPQAASDAKSATTVHVAGAAALAARAAAADAESSSVARGTPQRDAGYASQQAVAPPMPISVA